MAEPGIEKYLNDNRKMLIKEELRKNNGVRLLNRKVDFTRQITNPDSFLSTDFLE